MMFRNNEWAGHLAGMASEEMDEVYPIPNQYPLGKYLMVFDPLDGSSNVDINISVGTIFSILRAQVPNRAAAEADFLQPGVKQVCAGNVTLFFDDELGKRGAGMHERSFRKVGKR